VLSLLDHLYGTWFMPERTFRELREQPLIWQAAIVVILLNSLDAGRRVGFEAPVLIVSALFGLLGWVILASVLRMLAFTFGRDPRLDVVLVLTAFGALPWIFLAPVQALGGVLGAILGMTVLVWFGAWELWATAIALELPWWRLVWIVPLTFLAGFLAIAWAGSTIGALSSLG
jgi:hypothetical protein